MYGYRARIGYCSPPFVTETFCHEFYQMAPKGVTLMITTLAVTSLSSPSTAEQISESHARSLEAAKAMARAGADMVVLGGNPINQSLGMENLDTICIQLGQEIGTKVVTSTQSQIRALQALGARKVATVHPFGPEKNADHDRSMRNLGFEPTGVVACGYSVQDLGKIPGELAILLSSLRGRRKWPASGGPSLRKKSLWPEAGAP